MKPFRFQQFTVRQSKEVFRVGTDGVLLGALAPVEDRKNILEVGTGTGLISLMMAQRNLEAQILALDIDENAVESAEENFRNSPFSSRLKAVSGDFRQFKSKIKFDLIASNPPYFEENPSEKDVLARQTLTLNFENLIAKTAELLSDNGVVSVIIPSESARQFRELAKRFNLFPERIIHIYGIENGPERRNIINFSFGEKPCPELDFVIEKSPRKYSDQYLELTKNFHVFS